jgi:hypothetical protein
MRRRGWRIPVDDAVSGTHCSAVSKPHYRGGERYLNIDLERHERYVVHGFGRLERIAGDERQCREQRAHFQLNFYPHLHGCGRIGYRDGGRDCDTAGAHGDSDRKSDECCQRRRVVLDLELD